MPETPPVVEPPVDPPKPDDSPEYDTIGDMIDDIVGRTRKGFLKDLADLLDVGSSDDPPGGPSKTPEPTPTPKVSRTRKWNLL